MFESVTVEKARGGVLVVGHFKGEPVHKSVKSLDGDGAIAKAAKRAEATGDQGRLVECFPGKGAFRRAILVGLGDRASFSAHTVRSAIAAVGRRLSVTKDAAVSFELGGVCESAGLSGPDWGLSVGEALGLLGWTRDRFKGPEAKKEQRVALSAWTSDEGARAGMARGLGLAESANLARTVSETPPNIATPDWIAGQAEAMAKRAGLKVRVMRGEALEKERMIGLINVGKASENAPCLIRLEYRPAKAPKDAKPIVLIGKTMTYDSGGLSLKINNGMRGMKRDKDGGCAVLGAMHAVGTVVKPNVPVVAFLAAAENSISDEAYRPDDIITYRNGVTVEVTNTDAEGRLVLADALCWACEMENPECIVDLATLTGGVVTALGSTYCGMWCEDDALRGQIEAAGKATDERVWRLPMHQEYRDMMKSPVADIVNSNPNRKAHPIQGAAFLSFFVKKEIPWCHLDIAGVHEVESATGPYCDGPTGWGVRLLASWFASR